MRFVSGNVSDRKRLLRVSQGNLNNNHITITGHLDFFPSDAFGDSNREGVGAKPVKIFLTGLGVSVETDIPKDKNIFRKRAPFGEFYRKHDIQPGDVLALERVATREYRLYPFQTRANRDHSWHEFLEQVPQGDGLTVIELFAGCGGMSFGFKQAGFRTQLAVEWDEAACKTFRANISERVAQCAVEEVATFPKADVVVGGPPCQGFSNLGERVPYDPRRQLWRHFLRAVEDAEPTAFVMENVPPLLKSQEYVEVRQRSEELGYRVDGWVLNAADYGVPQTRKRAIIIGLRGDERPTKPVPTHCNHDKKGRGNGVWDLPNWVTVRDAMADLPMEPTDSDWHIGRNPTALSEKRYRSIPAGGNRFDLPRELTPDCWIRKVSGGTDLFGRLWWDRPSVTIRTEFFKPEKGRYLHPKAHRPITHREAMRLQGFPDDFEFVGSKSDVAKQVGNAVPPRLAKAIAAHLLQMIDVEVSSR